MGLLSSMTNGLIGLPNTKHECDVRIGELEKNCLVLVWERLSESNQMKTLKKRSSD